MMGKRTTRAQLWTFSSFTSRVGTSRLPNGTHVLVFRGHAQSAVQAYVGASRLVCGATAAVLSCRVAWPERVVELLAGETVAFLTCRCD